MLEAVPYFGVRSEEMGSQAALACWRALMSVLHIDADVEGVQDFRLDLSAWHLDALLLVHGRISMLRIEIGRATPRAGSDHMIFLLAASGCCHVRAASGEFLLQADGIVLLDAAQSASVRGNDCECILMVVPRQVFARFAAFSPGHMSGPLTSAPSLILGNHMLAIARNLPTMRQSDVPSVCEAASILIGGCLASRLRVPRRSEGDDISAVRLRGERYIDQNLGLPDLRPETISHNLSIPRSTLYRAFAAIGGIGSYIRGRRLDTARSLICHPEEHRSFASIAEVLGFDNAATFSKAFRRRFGCSPREMRRQRESGTHHAGQIFQAWRRAVEVARPDAAARHRPGPALVVDDEVPRGDPGNARTWAPV